MKRAANQQDHTGGTNLFRRLALALPAAHESSHMGSADFRVHDRIFATLAYASRGLGTLKITPEQQAMFLADAPQLFQAAAGGWGRMGMTLVRLDAPEDVLASAVQTAYNTVAGKRNATTPSGTRRSPAA